MVVRDQGRADAPCDGHVSIHALTMVLDFAPAYWNSGTRVVAMALADRVNPDDWTCWPSLEDMARRTGLSIRHVQKHLAFLQQEGIIMRQERRRDNGSQQSNLWIWLWKHEVPPQRRVSHTTPLEPSLLTHM